MAAFGEIGLTGRLRPAAQAERRLDECRKLGIAMVVAPEGTASRDQPRVVPVENLRSATRNGLAQAERAVEDEHAGEPALATAGS
jgi:predicted ATP-dependent serine protease